METDMRNNLAKARDKWLESKEGVRCYEGITSGQYLKNRLECAYIAGWDAKEKDGEFPQIADLVRQLEYITMILKEFAGLK